MEYCKRKQAKRVLLFLPLSLLFLKARVRYSMQYSCFILYNIILYISISKKSIKSKKEYRDVMIDDDAQNTAFGEELQTQPSRQYVVALRDV